MKYYMTINGGSLRETRELGMSLTGLELQNMQADSAALRWTRRRVSDACPLVHNDTVEIFADERRIFRGRARLGTLTSEGMSLSIVGPWSHLEELTSHMTNYSTSRNSYLGLRVGDEYETTYLPGDTILKTDGSLYTVPAGGLTVTWTVGYVRTYTGGASTGTVEVNRLWSARHWLFRPGGTVGQIYTTLADQLSQILAGVAQAMAPLTFPVGTTALGATLAPKVRTVADIPMSECVRQCLAMKPDAAVWWDYGGTGVPALQARVASLETPLALTVGAGDRVMSHYQVKVMDELVPAGVVVRWEPSVSTVTGLGNAVYSLFDVYPAATASYAPRVLVHTVDDDVPYVPGISQEVYNSLAVRRAQGSISVVDRDFSLGLRPGRTITLTGDPALAGVQFWVQSVSWDAASGTAQISVGYPVHLQLRDRIDLKGWFAYTFQGTHVTTTQIIPAP